MTLTRSVQVPRCHTDALMQHEKRGSLCYYYALGIVVVVVILSSHADVETRAPGKETQKNWYEMKFILCKQTNALLKIKCFGL